MMNDRELAVTTGLVRRAGIFHFNLSVYSAITFPWGYNFTMCLETYRCPTHSFGEVCDQCFYGRLLKIRQELEELRGE